jgi:hypothetical protein
MAAKSVLPTQSYNLNKPLLQLTQEAMRNLVTLSYNKKLGKTASGDDVLADEYECADLLNKELQDFFLMYSSSPYHLQFHAEDLGGGGTYELQLEVSMTREHPLAKCFDRINFFAEVPIGTLERVVPDTGRGRTPIFDRVEGYPASTTRYVVSDCMANDLLMECDLLAVRMMRPAFERLKELSDYLRLFDDKELQGFASCLNQMVGPVDPDPNDLESVSINFMSASDATDTEELGGVLRTRPENLLSLDWIRKVEGVVSDMKAGVAAKNGGGVV